MKFDTITEAFAVENFSDLLDALASGKTIDILREGKVPMRLYGRRIGAGDIFNPVPAEPQSAALVPAEMEEYFLDDRDFKMSWLD